MAKSEPIMEDTVQETLAEILKNMGVTFRKFKVHQDKDMGTAEPLLRIDIDTDEASTLIGYRGENIHALQHILKTLIWKKTNQNVFVILDIDGYRKRQEENVISLTMRKVEAARKTLQTQTLPPMSPYFRRIVHMYLTKPGFEDLVTESVGENDRRAVTIKVKS